MLSNLAITAVVALGIGMLIQWGRGRARLRALEANCAEKLEAAEEQLALERLQLEWRLREAMENGGPAAPSTSLPTFQMYRDAHLARPRSAAPDSSTSRA